MASARPLWVGCYTPEDGGRGTGIVQVDAMGRPGTPIPMRSPSFLVPHPFRPVLYAAAEGTGEVVTVGIGESAAIASGLASGVSVCHVAINAAGTRVVAAAWGDGTVTAHDLDDDGAIVRSCVLPPAGGAATPGGRTSRAHATCFLRDGGFVTTDLGLSLLRFWRDRDGVVEEATLELAQGSGPRHLVEHPDGRILVATEFSDAVVIVRRERGGAPRVCHTVPLGAAGAADPGRRPSELALDRTGRRLYVAVRGADEIVSLAVGDRVERIGATPSGGRTPRHFVLTEGAVHVAHQDSDELTTLAVDPATGAIGAVLRRVRLGSPTVVVAA